MEAKKLDAASDVESRVVRVIQQTFGLKSPKEAKEMRMGSHPKWDSMGHMTLIAAIESEFKLQLPTFAFNELTSAAQITDAICSGKFR